MVGQSFLALEQGGMRIIETAIEWMRREIAQIFLVQFAQRSDQRTPFLHDLRGIGIGFEFVAPRPPVLQRGKPECQRPSEQTEEKKGRSDMARAKTKRAIEPLLACQPGNHIEGKEESHG